MAFHLGVQKLHEAHVFLRRGEPVLALALRDKELVCGGQLQDVFAYLLLHIEYLGDTLLPNYHAARYAVGVEQGVAVQKKRMLYIVSELFPILA